jgi:hypothetical protein
MGIQATLSPIAMQWPISTKPTIMCKRVRKLLPWQSKPVRILTAETATRDTCRRLVRNLVSEEAVRTALTGVLTGRLLLGEFDHPADLPWSGLSPEVIEGQQHRSLAREAARQSLVLLKNEKQSLPLDKHKLKKVAIIGPMAGSCHWAVTAATHVSRIVIPRRFDALGSVPYGDTVPAGEYVSTSNFLGPNVDFADDGTQRLTAIRNKGWDQYGPLDISGRTSIEFKFASSADGDIEDIHFDRLGGTPAMTVHAPATGGMERVEGGRRSTIGRHRKSCHFSQVQVPRFGINS